MAILMAAPLTIMAQSKFAHFHLAEILPNMKEYATAQTELQNMEKQFSDDLKLMQDEMQKKYEDYQKEAPNLLENVRARREQELNDLGPSIRAFVTAFSENLSPRDKVYFRSKYLFQLKSFDTLTGMRYSGFVTLRFCISS